MKKILLIGKNGQIGWELQRSLAPLGEVIACSREEMDLLDLSQIREVIQACKPDILINAAAYTAVDAAEKEPELAYKINALAPAVMAEETKKLQALLVHYSTDYVFDGQAQHPYVENSTTHPLNVYGETKLAGEKAIENNAGKYLILRTAWVYGMRGKNFLRTILELAKQDKPINIVSDQMGCPTWCRLVAEATAQILACQHDILSGVYHMTCAGEASRFQFAEAVLSHISHDPQPVLNKILTKDYPTLAKRPPYTVLDNQKLYDHFGLRLTPWKTALDLCLSEIDL